MSESQWKTNAMISFNPPKPPSYTLKEWNLNNRIRYESSAILQHSADNLLAKSDQIRDIAVEVIKTNKEETDHRLIQKIRDIKYRRKEILHNRAEVVQELDALETYKIRLIDTLKSVKRNALDICEKCLSIREHRIGIDLVHDEVKKELQMEMKVIKGAQSLLEKTLEDTQEQIRKLKAALHFLDCDLREKDENLRRNQSILRLEERHVNLKSVEGFACNPSNTTLKEWEYQTIANLQETCKEMKRSRTMRNHIDSVIQDTIRSLNLQVEMTNNAFLRRCDETNEQKSKLEAQHAEIVQKADEMSKNVARLEKSIAEKEGFLALVQTRINTHCQLSGLENTRDPVQMHLVKELRDLNDIVTKLHQTLAEARTALRLLLKMQVQLEEDINIKINTLKIDEVDCMCLRQSIDFRAY